MLVYEDLAVISAMGAAYTTVTGEFRACWHNFAYALVAQERWVARGDDLFHVLGAPARVGDGEVALAQPGVHLQVLLLDITTPGVLFLEQVGVDLLQALVHLLGLNVQVLPPVIGDVVQGLIQGAAALLHEGHHEALFVDRVGAEAGLGGAGGAEGDELAGVAVVALGAAVAEGSPLGGLRGAEVADHDLVGESPAARAGELAGEDIVDRPLPVNLHVRYLKG